MRLAQHLKARRLELGYTQERLADAARLSKRTIARIESGHPAQAETLLAVCSVLRLDHAEAEALRRAEQAGPAPAPPVLVPDSVGVSRDLLPDALAAIAGEPDIALVVLPDLAAWRAAGDPGRGADLSRTVYAAKARFWKAIDAHTFLLILAALVIPSLCLAWIQAHASREVLVGAFAVTLPALLIGLSIGGDFALKWGPQRQQAAWLERRLERMAYAVSGDCVREILVLDHEVQVRRLDLADKVQAKRIACGVRVSYEIATRTGGLTLHALPQDERLDAILLRTGPGDVVRRIPRGALPLAA